MNELEHVTLREAIVILRERVEKSRFTEETARRERERDESALVALQALLGEAEPSDVPPSTLNGRKRLVGLAAVRQVMREDPLRVWSPTEIHEELETRGWLSGKASHPRAGTESAVGRLLAKGQISKIARGQYRWRDEQEALTEN